jgi:Flp pilus assembly protein TadD
VLTRPRSLSLVVYVALGVFVARIHTGSLSAASAPATPITLLPPPPTSASDAEQRDRDIVFYAERAARDTLSASDRSRLAELYLSRARETGSFEDLARAEGAERASLALRGAHNSRTRQLLASTLMARHRFGEALGVARRLMVDEPDVATFRALYGECQLEVGDYTGADTTFGRLQREARQLAVAPRIARWYELAGRTRDAERLLLWARDDARRQGSGMSAEQRAWFELRVGDFHLRHGRMSAADSALQAGLAMHPGDYRILGELAKLELARGRYGKAAEYGESAIAVVLEPATLGTLADAYAAMGDSARSEDFARALETSVKRQPGAYHRAWSLWLLDHDRDVTRVSRKVEQELRARRDVYGLDLYAWSLHKRGRDAEARSVMTGVLARGIDDPLLSRHAAALGLAPRSAQ